MKRLSVLLVVVTLATAAPATSQVQVEKRRPAPATGEVHIDNDFGSVIVRAWDNQEVLVRGTLAPGADGLDLDGDQEGVDLHVHVPDHWFHATGDDTAYASNLEVFAPVGSSLAVDSVNADITVEGFRGDVEISSTNGSITLTGPARQVDAETMTGRIELAVEGAPVEVESISGPVFVTGARTELDIQTVSAPVEVSGVALASVDIETTTGAVTLRGALATEGDVDIETFSGPVTLILPAAVKARFELESFSGEIRSALGAGTPSDSERFSPYSRLRFSTGLDGYEVTVRTHDADIVIETE